MICAPVASARAVTSSPPTTSDSLLASARSMPSVSATIVGPEAGRADDRVEHEVGVRARRPARRGPRARRAPRPRSTPPPRAPRRRGPTARSGARRGRAPARPAARARCPRTGRRSRTRRRSTSSACVPIEPVEPEDEEPLHRRPIVATTSLRARMNRRAAAGAAGARTTARRVPARRAPARYQSRRAVEQVVGDQRDRAARSRGRGTRGRRSAAGWRTRSRRAVALVEAQPVRGASARSGRPSTRAVASSVAKYRLRWKS